MASSAEVTPTQAALSLLNSLSNEAKVLTDPSSLAFKHSMKRWSDLGIKIPSAILLPASEPDIITIVTFAVKHHIPIVAKSGGHSPWSTVASPGWIIDLSLFTGVKLDTQKHTATVQAGVGTKQLNAAVSEAGFCIQSPGASTVGYIPFLLGGGSTWLTGMYGLAVDNLISARVITATRGLVTASASENADLFWALKGAGQFFGLVTAVTAQIFPLEQKITAWTCIFLPAQMKDVAKVVAALANGDDSAKSPGMAAVLAAPGQTKPIILINTMHFRPGAEADTFVAPLLALNPVQKIRKEIDFVNITDAAEALNVQGGLKAQISCGMQTFAPEKFEKTLHSFSELVERYPSAAGCGFMFNWYATQAMREREGEGSAYSHRDCGVWSMSFVMSPEEDAAAAAFENAKKILEMSQADQKEDEKALFPNHTRDMSLEQRYRGEERRERLAKLKNIWDPEGVFTSQFL